MKILIVDDEVVSRSKLQKIMSNFGHCEAVESGPAALDAFKNAWAHWTPFDLITLDVLMPGMDGMETLLEIRRMESENGVAEKNRAKVLMVTMQSSRSTVVTCIQGGCDDYIVKPLNLQLVSQKILELGFKISFP
jgi:DNA-binding response OmpR family regulator